jgi:2-polyprenyl-3-methyl-5-hydroxy-6-metoxy-1,4-benzoquinol methylase
VISTNIFPPLVCPTHLAPLQNLGLDLICEHGHQFKVRAGIPRVVPSESSYADAFGAQWNTFRKTQLDSFTKTQITQTRVRRCLGDALWQRLNGGDPVAVLETGCGAGRFTEVLLATRSAFVTSTDLSSAVEANQLNCPQSERHRIIQCDICQMPFVAGSYDMVICLGVVQHTPDPEGTIAKLYEQVKPGGWLVMDHYAPSLAMYTKVTARLMRPVLKRLPPAQGLRATQVLTNLFFPLHRAVRKRRSIQHILSRISPLITYYHAFPELDDKHQYEWALLDTHDSLTDYYKHLRNREQITATLSRLGARNVSVTNGGNGVEARCQKPE